MAILRSVAEGRTLCGVLAMAGVLVVAVAPATVAAAPISVSGTGGSVPNHSPGGASFDIVIANPGNIAATGNNVTLTLTNLVHQHMVDLTVTLEHVGFGGAKEVFDLVLDNAGFVCGSTLNGDYSFNSGAATSMRDACSANGTGVANNNAVTVPSGTYRTTTGDDVTDSGLSSFWNGQSVSGTWRLFVSDRDVSGSSFANALNSDWNWRLDIEVAGSQVPEPGTLGLLALPGLGLAAMRSLRRRKTT